MDRVGEWLLDHAWAVIGVCVAVAVFVLAPDAPLWRQVIADVALIVAIAFASES